MNSYVITFNAIKTIRPNGSYTVTDTYESLRWLDGNDDEKPTEKEFNDAVTAYKAEYDAQEYARNRQAEYPDWGTQLNKIYDDGIAKWKTEMVDPIKAKYPKPE